MSPFISDDITSSSEISEPPFPEHTSRTHFRQSIRSFTTSCDSTQVVDGREDEEMAGFVHPRYHVLNL